MSGIHFKRIARPPSKRDALVAACMTRSLARSHGAQLSQHLCSLCLERAWIHRVFVRFCQGWTKTHFVWKAAFPVRRPAKHQSWSDGFKPRWNQINIFLMLFRDISFRHRSVNIWGVTVRGRKSRFASQLSFQVTDWVREQNANQNKAHWIQNFRFWCFKHCSLCQSRLWSNFLKKSLLLEKKHLYTWFKMRRHHIIWANESF